MAYGMSKIALEHLTVSVAAQLRADRIPVNTFRIDVPVASEGFVSNSPGWVDRTTGSRARSRPRASCGCCASRPSTPGTTTGWPRCAPNTGSWRRVRVRPHESTLAVNRVNPMPLPLPARVTTAGTRTPPTARRAAGARSTARRRGPVEPAPRPARVRELRGEGGGVALVDRALPRPGTRRAAPVPSRQRCPPGVLPRGARPAPRSRSRAATAPRVSCCTSSCTGRSPRRPTLAHHGTTFARRARRRDRRVLRTRARRPARGGVRRGGRAHRRAGDRRHRRASRVRRRRAAPSGPQPRARARRRLSDAAGAGGAP